MNASTSGELRSKLSLASFVGFARWVRDKNVDGDDDGDEDDRRVISLEVMFETMVVEEE